MKKSYEKPYAEKIEFHYEDQVVATSSTECLKQWSAYGTPCTNPVVVRTFGDT